MSATYSQPILPWSGPQPEDLRFRRVLASVLALFLVVGATIPYLRVPQLESDLAPVIPARLARIIAEPNGPVQAAVAISLPRQAMAQQATSAQKAPDKQPGKAPATVADKSPPTPAPGVAPRRKSVEKVGLLAMSDALNSLRSATPSIVTDVPLPARTDSEGRSPALKTQALTAGVTEGSGGIGVGMPTHQQVLGANGSAIGDIASVRRQGDVADRTGRLAARDTPGGRRGKIRTEEEIQEVLDRNKRAIYRIYNLELLADPSLHGKVVASISIAPSGKVTDCRIVYSDLGARSFEEQLVALIKRIDFGPKPGVPAVTTRVPIEFFPS
ncbi:MAG: AgmX/PglI C-terminal domain-containing protein [Sedimenticolaceae bacterium]